MATTALLYASIHGYTCISPVRKPHVQALVRRETSRSGVTTTVVKATCTPDPVATWLNRWAVVARLGLGTGSRIRTASGTWSRAVVASRTPGQHTSLLDILILLNGLGTQTRVGTGDKADQQAGDEEESQDGGLERLDHGGCRSMQRDQTGVDKHSIARIVSRERDMQHYIIQDPRPNKV
jgi:hypothetical protein